MSEKFQYFRGVKFTRDDNTGYYLNTTIHKRMHVFVWEFYNGEIPEGCEIHHIDRDKSNNDINNLQLLSSTEHKELHARLLTDEEREWRRNNMNNVARPKAIEWHKSEEGKEWHKKQYERTKEALHRKHQRTCINCGKEFMGHTTSKYCCNACKSAYRRKQNIDITYPQICVVCGAHFMTNKYRIATCCSKKCASVLAYQNRGVMNESEISKQDN